MPPTRHLVAREFFRSVLFQVLRGLLWGWTARLIAKGYLTGGQAEYVLVALVSILVTATSVVLTSVYRFARAEALRHSTPDTPPENIHRLMWQIVWQLLNIQPTENTTQ